MIVGKLADAMRLKAKLEFRGADNPPREEDYLMLRSANMALRAILGDAATNDLIYESKTEVNRTTHDVYRYRTPSEWNRLREARRVRALFFLFLAEVLESEGL